MADWTSKDFFGDGYTTHHADGSTSHTFKDFFGDGFTTHHSDGKTSHTRKDFLGNGSTTYHSDGSTSHTYKDFLGEGYTTYHSDGGTSHTYKDFLGDGFTTYHSGTASPFSFGGALGNNPIIESQKSGATGIGGYYGGGYYGGTYSSSGVSTIGVGGFIGYSLIIGLIGYAIWFYRLGFAWYHAASFVAIALVGVIDRNISKDWDRQTVWFRWCCPLVTIFGLIFIRVTYSLPDPILQLVVWMVIPVVYVFLMGLALRGLINPLNTASGFVDLVIVPVFCVFCLPFANRADNQTIYYILVDALFLFLEDMTDD